MSVKKNFAYNLIYQVMQLILPLVTAPYVSRVLGAEGLGAYSYSFSIATYFVMFAMLGVNNYGNREIARSRMDRAELSGTFCSIWALQLILSIIMISGYVIYVFIGAPDKTCAFAMVPYVVSSAIDVNWLFFGLEQFVVTVTRSFVIRLISFVLTFVLVRGQYALLNYCLLISVNSFLSAVVLWPFVKKSIDFVVPPIHDVISRVKPNLVLFLPVIAVSFYTVLDKVMLGYIAGNAEVGIFENSFKVATMPFTIITALGTVMMPHISNLYAEDRRDEAIASMAPSMWAVILLSFAFTYGLIAVTPEFVPVFFGPGFQKCLIAMPLIVAEMPFMAWANVIRTQLLIPTSRDRAYVSSVVVGAISNIVVNILLINRFGAVGAAVGTLIAEIAVCLVQTWAVRYELPLYNWLKESIPGCTIGFLMYVVVRRLAIFMPSGALGLALEVAIGVFTFTFFSLIWYFGTDNAYAKALVYSIVNRLKR